MTHTRSRAHLTSCTVPQYTAHNRPRITAYKLFHVQPEDGHCQVTKHVVVPYAVNNIHVQGPPKKCIHTLTKENSTLYNRLL